MGQRLKLWCVTAEKGLKKFSKNTTFYHGIAQRYSLYVCIDEFVCVLCSSSSPIKIQCPFVTQPLGNCLKNKVC